MPALPPSILEPLWDQFAALLPHRDDPHPLGCHRARIPDRVIFDKLIQILVFGCGYRRIADHTCSATTLRRRRDEWITLGVAEQLRLLVLDAYDRLLGLELTHLAVDGCITKTPCGGQTAGPSPVDRAKQGGKRSVAVEADGIPLGAVAAPANRRDDGLLAATLQTLGSLGPLPTQPAPTVHLDAGYDWKPCRDELAARGLVGRIARRGQPAPSRSAAAGSSNGPTPGRTTTASYAGAPNAVREWSTSGSRSPSPSSPWDGSSAAPGPTTGGTAVPADAHNGLLAQPLSHARAVTSMLRCAWI